MNDRSAGSAPLCAAPQLAGASAWLVSRRGIVAALGFSLATLVGFRLFPDWDLGTAAAFYAGGEHFIGQTPGGVTLRHIFSAIPFLLVSLMLGFDLVRRFQPAVWGPGGRALAFLLISLALGPGLLVNVVLKDHSHRPRPVQTEGFGGTMPFRPVGSFDGACTTNCSFVSGEGASAFWTLAPALLVPASLQPVALLAALGFATAASLLRMAFGGHYLSDTLMAAALDWLVIAACFRVLMRPTDPPRRL